MTEHLHLRIIENKDWATLLFISCFAVIAIIKSVYENRFSEFTKLIFTNKYTKIYRDSKPVTSVFTIALFFLQIISFTFFIQLTLSSFGYVSKTDWILYIQILTIVSFIILAKYLITKIVATSFNIEEIIEDFNLQKLSYRAYIGILILPVNIILFYYDDISTVVQLTILAVSLCLGLFYYFISIKTYQNIIWAKLFYFILYLCTLEIAPYYFVYYCFTKGVLRKYYSL